MVGVMTMRSIQLVAPRQLEECEVAQPPEPGPGEVLVQVRAVGICGSDLHYYLDGRIGRHAAVYPHVLGHEPAGVVVAAGPGVTYPKVGERVALEPAITCQRCEFCLSGHPNNCLRVVFMSSPPNPGFFLEYALLPAHNALPIPDSLSFAQTTLAEPLAVILHVLELVEIRVGDTVAVLGAGPIGLLCAAVARTAGASTVFVADRVPHRLRLAQEVGADIAINMASESLRDAVQDMTRARGVDIVLDAAGAAETINAGIAIARPGGQIALIGIPGEAELPIDLHTAMAKELNLQTIKRSNHNAQAAIELLKTGRIRDSFVTHRLPLEKTPAAFESLASYADGVGKIVIEIPG